MKNIKFIILLFISFNNLCANTEIIPEQKQTQLAVYNFPENHAKLLNQIFLDNPIYTLKLQSSYKKAQTIILKKNEIKDTEIESLKNELLKPVDYILPVLHKKVFRFITEPLLLALLSLESKQFVLEKSQSKELTLENIFKYLDLEKIPASLQFLNTDEKEAGTFFDKFIKNKTSLLIVCQEFTSFFESINNTFTDETKNKAIEFYKKLIEQSKNKK
ncbi:MAG: hypothetical protein SZ59_C0002G0088 [candidate division TM6 bacterium GW2011_GWF2_28_16]|jgi:hypothetical protein|nr:MAG: hypothetical protein SZ59_C0002G0088 [candidate division TM6 bacterium GW2011_GWF2_28_16]